MFRSGFLTTKDLTLRMMSVDILDHAGERGNSCCALVHANLGDGAAFEDGEQHARRLLPTVEPKPRSKGSATICRIRV